MGDVDEMVPIPVELPHTISRLTAAKLYQCTVASSGYLCTTRSFLDMVNARQVHKYPEEDRERLRLKARYCAEQHHLGLGNGGDPLVLPLRPAAAESFVSPRPSPDCGLRKRRSIPVGAIESVQKFKCLKQMEVTQLRRQVADAEKGVTGLLVRVQEVVSELDSRGEKVAKLEKRLEKLQAQRAADQERIAGQAKQLAQAKRSSWEKAQSTEQQLAELEVKVRERLGEELVAQKAHAEQYAGRKRKQAQRAKTESGRKIQSLEDRNAAILKMLDGWRETQSNVVTEVTLENDRAVKSFATKINGKQYAPRIRAMYYCMLSDGVPTRKCEQHLRDILQLAGIKLDDDVKLPGQKAAAGMVADVQALTHIQMARRTLKAADGSISFGCDGARKSYGGQSKDRFAVVQSVSRAGAGTEIITTPVAVVDMLGGDGLSHTEAFEYVYAEAAGCWNIRNRVEGSTERIESTALTKKFVGGCTDSCAAQQVGNRGVFRTIDAARDQDAHVGVADDLGAEEEAGATPVPAPPNVEKLTVVVMCPADAVPGDTVQVVPLLQPGSATPCDMVQMEGELRVEVPPGVSPGQSWEVCVPAPPADDGPAPAAVAEPAWKMTQFFCFLHKIMNLIKAAKKALAANREDTIMSQVRAQADDRKLTKILNGPDTSLDKSRAAQSQSAGMMAIWLLFKIYSPLSTNENISRGWEYAALLKESSVVLKWMKVLGNRDLSWTANADVLMRLFVDRSCGVLHCSNCKQRFPHFAQMVSEGCSAPDTTHTCILCHNEAKFDGKMKAVPLNKADKATTGFMSNPEVLLDNLVLGAVGEQVTTPALRCGQSLFAVDIYDMSRRIRAALHAIAADPRPYLTGSKRALGDRAWIQWKFEGPCSDRAMTVFFEEELRERLPKELTAAVGNLLPGPELESLLKEQKEVLEREATDSIQENWKTVYAYGKEPARAAMSSNELAMKPFTLDAVLHVCPVKNYLADLSEYMCEEACKLMKPVIAEMLVMHERQSGEIADTVLTKDERRRFSSVPSCNDGSESLLGQICFSLTSRPNQKTVAASAIAVSRASPVRRSIVDMLINPATTAAAELDIEAARLGGIMITAHDKARCEMIEAYDVKNAQNKKARRVELKQNAAALKAKYASVAMVEEHAR